jgi:hypothetical protein
MSLIHNETTKLTATLLNTIAAGTVITGFLAPIAAFVFQVPGAGMTSGRVFAITVGVWLLFAAGLHMLARRVLRRLRE